MRTVHILIKSTPDSLGRHRNQTLVGVYDDPKEVKRTKRRMQAESKESLAFVVNEVATTSTL